MWRRLAARSFRRAIRLAISVRRSDSNAQSMFSASTVAALNTSGYAEMFCWRISIMRLPRSSLTASLKAAELDAAGGGALADEGQIFRDVLSADDVRVRIAGATSGHGRQLPF